MNKKILFMVPSLGLGGMERMLVNIANALIRRGYHVTILNCTFIDEAIRSDLDPRITYLGSFNAKKFLFRASFKDLLDGNIRILPFKLWSIIHSPKYLYKCYIKDKYDAEIAFFRGFTVKVISGSTNKASKKLAWVHNDYKLCGGIINSFSGMKAVKRAYAKFDKIVCVSNQAAESFKEVIGIVDPVTTIYNLLPRERIMSMSEESICDEKSGLTFVTVGRLVEAKGYDRLIDAVEKLSRLSFSFRMWIIGDGPELCKLSGLIRERVVSNVILLGRQDNPYKYVSKADVFVCASRWEGYSLAVAEALILGVPVISTECTGPREILNNGEYGMLVDNSAEGLYDGMKQLLENKELFEYYRNQAKKRAPFFEEDKIVDQIEAVL